MEYLDPEKKRKHRQRIALGYVLIGLLISMVTIIILLAGYGYGFDRKTGEFVQNGIMFVDTEHRPAQVSLNGKAYGQTDLRLVLREGEYSLLATRDGYRNWSRTIDIKGGELRKLTYGLLIPEVLQPTQQLTLEERPSRALQSIDKDRIVAWDPEQYQTLLLFDISVDPATVTRLPLDNLLATIPGADPDEPPVISDVVFHDFDSTDQRLLADITIDKKIYTWLLDTGDITQSRNISNALPAAFGSSEIEISMIDRDPARYYVFDVTAGEVYQAELQGNSLSLITIPDIDEKVLAFTGFDTDWMLFVTESTGQEGLVNVQFRQGEETILLKQMKTSKEYYLSLANNGGKPFIGTGATEEIAVFVYTDPIEYLKQSPTSTVPAPSTIMPMEDVMNVSVSSDASILMAHGPSRVATYDFQAEEVFYRDLEHTLEKKTQLRWIDGQHYVYVDSGLAWISDYDGSNAQQLTAASSIGIFYRADSEGYYAFATNDTQEDSTSSVQALLFTSLLSEEDR